VIAAYYCNHVAQISCVHVLFTCAVEIYKIVNAALEVEGTADVENVGRL